LNLPEQQVGVRPIPATDPGVLLATARRWYLPGMRSTTAFAVLVAATLLAGSARAEDPPDPIRAAGWAVMGLSASLGGGSIATGVVLLSDGYWSDHNVGSATLIGGIVTVAVGLVAGLPMALHAGSARPADRPPERTALQRALSGEIRF
jgi:hypothetical protein